MKKLCAMIGKYFGIIAILFLILGFTMPENFNNLRAYCDSKCGLSKLREKCRFGFFSIK